MTIEFNSKTNVKEYFYWCKQEIIDLVDFIANEDEFIFLKGTEFYQSQLCNEEILFNEEKVKYII